MSLVLFSSGHAQEVPAQFKIWGRQAVENKALPDAGLDEDASEAPQASAKERTQGLFVFSRPCSDHVTPDILANLDPADRCHGLFAADCRGQYGPLSFCVVALKKGGFSPSVSELIGPGGEKIPAASFDVRAVRYALLTDRHQKPVVSPVVLEAFEKKTIAANRLQQFWITYHIPEKAAPGTYEGAVTVAGDEGKVVIPLKITVYPFDLAANPTDAYIYFNTGSQSPELLAKQLRDQRLHGMTMSMIGVPVTRSGEHIKEKLVSLLDLYVQAGFDRNIHMQLANRVMSEWLWEPDKSIGMWGPWSRYYPLTEKLDTHFLDIAKVLDEEVTKRGLKLVLTVSDEAGAHPWTVKATQHYFQLLKEKLPDVTRELTVGGGWAMKQPEHELWRGLIQVWTTNRWLPDKLAIVKQDDPAAKIQLYNMGGPGSGAGGTGSSRNLYGFFAWKAQAAGETQWVYGDNDAHSHVWAAREKDAGPVPTLHWEAIREGAKDRQYIATLEKAIRGQSGRNVQQANAVLKEISDAILLSTENREYDPIAGGKIPAPQPGGFEQWRGKIAEQIIALGSR